MSNRSRVLDVVVPLAALLAVTGKGRAADATATYAQTMRGIAVAEDRRDWAGGTLRAALRSADARVRQRAVQAVGRLQDSTSVPALLPLLSDRRVRTETVFALGQIGHRSARAALEKALGADDPWTVDLAVEALGKLGDPASTPLLTPFLKRGRIDTRERACEALWRIPRTHAAGPLMHA